MELMEDLHNDDNSKVKCRTLKEHMERYSETKEPKVTQILHEFQICLACGYTLWEEHCSTCTSAEIILLKIRSRDKGCLNMGRAFLVSLILKFKYFINQLYRHCMQEGVSQKSMSKRRCVYL